MDLQIVLVITLLATACGVGITAFLFSFSITGFTLWGKLLDLFKVAEGFNILIWFLVLSLVLMIGIYRQKKPFPEEIKKILIPWLVFIIYLVIRTFIPGNGFSAYGFEKIGVVLLKGLFPAALFLVWLVNVRDERDKVELVIFILGLLLAVLTIYDYFIFQEKRTVVLGINPIWLARYIALAAIALINLSVKYYYKLPLLVLFTIGIIFTGSRGPFLALMLVLLIKLFLYLKVQYSRRGYLPLVVTLLLVLIFALTFNGFIDNFITRGNEDILQENSLSTRIRLYKMAFSDFLANPILGKGLGTFSYNQFDYSHNIVLELLGETGILGLILFILAVKPGITFNFSYRFADYFVFAVVSALFSGDLGKNSYIVPLCLLVLISRYLKEKDHNRNERRS